MKEHLKVYLVDGRNVFMSENYSLLNYNIIKIDLNKPNKKRVTFNIAKNTILTTYSSDEYDRKSIDSLAYLRTLQRISQNEWNSIMHDLNNYKMNEMIVHKDSLK